MTEQWGVYAHQGVGILSPNERQAGGSLVLQLRIAEDLNCAGLGDIVFDDEWRITSEPEDLEWVGIMVPGALEKFLTWFEASGTHLSVAQSRQSDAMVRLGRYWIIANVGDAPWQLSDAAIFAGVSVLEAIHTAPLAPLGAGTIPSNLVHLELSCPAPSRSGTPLFEPSLRLPATLTKLSIRLNRARSGASAAVGEVAFMLDYHLAPLRTSSVSSFYVIAWSDEGVRIGCSAAFFSAPFAHQLVHLNITGSRLLNSDFETGAMRHLSDVSDLSLLSGWPSAHRAPIRADVSLEHLGLAPGPLAKHWDVRNSSLNLLSLQTAELQDLSINCFDINPPVVAGTITPIEVRHIKSVDLQRRGGAYLFSSKQTIRHNAHADDVFAFAESFRIYRSLVDVSSLSTTDSGDSGDNGNAEEEAKVATTKSLERVMRYSVHSLSHAAPKMAAVLSRLGVNNQDAARVIKQAMPGQLQNQTIVPQVSRIVTKSQQSQDVARWAKHVLALLYVPVKEIEPLMLL
jgi:hypothetical protein